MATVRRSPHAVFGPHSGYGFSVTPAEAERFWDHVLLGDDCWLWDGYILHGYGKMTIARINSGGVMAHRISWAIAHGRAVPAGKVVMHTCNNKRCVRPDHLRVGTQGDNLRAAIRDRLVVFERSAVCLVCGARRSPRAGSCALCLRCWRKKRRATPVQLRASFLRAVKHLRLTIPFVPPSSFDELARVVGARRAEVFARRYGFYDREPHRLDAIAKDIGLTRERVRQICERVGELMSTDPQVHSYLRDRKAA